MCEIRCLEGGWRINCWLFEVSKGWSPVSTHQPASLRQPASAGQSQTREHVIKTRPGRAFLKAVTRHRPNTYLVRSIMNSFSPAPVCRGQSISSLGVMFDCCYSGQEPEHATTDSVQTPPAHHPPRNILILRIAYSKQAQRPPAADKLPADSCNLSKACNTVPYNSCRTQFVRS